MAAAYAPAVDVVTFYEAGKTANARIETSTAKPQSKRYGLASQANPERKLVVTGSWNIAGCGKVVVEFAENAPSLVLGSVLLENEGAVPPDPRARHSEGSFWCKVGLQAATNATYAPIPPPMPTLQAVAERVRFIDINSLMSCVWPHPYWSFESLQQGNNMRCWTLDVSKPVVKVTYAWKGNVTPVRIYACGPANKAVEPLPGFAKIPPDKFFPFMDRYGQFKWKEWPGKTHSDADLKQSLVDEEADLAAHPAPASFDRWGGWKDGPKQKATGSFYLKKINGFWWFVDPDGNLWWSHGPLRVTTSSAMTFYNGRENYFEWLPPKEGDAFSLFYKTRDELMWPYWVKRGITNTFDFSSCNIYRKYGPGPDWREKWARHVHRRLRSWGANTIGNSSDRKVVEMSLTPYVERFEVKSRPIEGTDVTKGWWPVRDPYDPTFAANVRQQLRDRRYQVSDPWCVGFYVDNELPWGFEGHVGDIVWASPEDQPAKAEFRRWLKRRHGEDWTEPPTDEDRKAFSGVVAEEYFRQIRLAFDECAPGKLYLGCRGMALEYIVRAAEKYVDTLSQNYYARDLSDFFKEYDNKNYGCAALGIVDMPILIGEFHCGSKDRGPLSPTLVAVKDQNERAQVYRQYVVSALEHPKFVGTSWHQFSDQPTTARFDGESMQNGWTDVCDTPYAETVEAIRWVGENMYRIRWEASLRAAGK